MPTLPAIKRSAAGEPAFDHRQLFAFGIDQVRRLARELWTDHNLHDPGITILELLCFALTDLAYRAAFPVEDLFAADPADPGARRPLLFGPAEVLPGAPATATDYRRLLLDIQGVREAWLAPEPLSYFADPATGLLHRTNAAGRVEVEVRGLYRVRLAIAEARTREQVVKTVRSRLEARRNLGEDFVVGEEESQLQEFAVCGELELAPGGDPARVMAQVLFALERFFDPPVRRYSLAEILAKPRKNGALRELAEVLEGPLPARGFLDEEELEELELRWLDGIHLSDVIGILMDLPGILAVRDIVVNPLDAAGNPVAAADKWQIPVVKTGRPVFTRDKSRLILYKRHLPIAPDPAAVEKALEGLRKAGEIPVPAAADLLPPAPRGRFRRPAGYTSFQNHFPALYGLSIENLPAGTAAEKKRRAQIYQLKAYLLFFDQLMADFCAQLAGLSELFSIEEQQLRTYFSQPVDSFPGFGDIYGAGAGALLEDFEKKNLEERQIRLLDHLLATFGENLHEDVAILHSAFGIPPEATAKVKRSFLGKVPELGAERGLGFDRSAGEDPMGRNPANRSGVEKRILRRLDLNFADLREDLYLIENLLLRPEPGEDGPFLPICADELCGEGCAGNDPYSYRVHVVFPAAAGRFANFEFRRYVADVVREEMPAHVLPKICWAAPADWTDLEAAYLGWRLARQNTDPSIRTTATKLLIEVLFRIKNVYPEGRLHACGPARKTEKFILGRSALGTASERPAPAKGGHGDV